VIHKNHLDMSDNREQYHREIHQMTGYIAHRVEAVIKKYQLPYTPNALEKSYRRYAKQLDLNIEKKTSDNAYEHLDKLNDKLSAFDDILEELMPDNNPLDLPPSQENDYAAFKIPNNHNNILLLSDIHVPYHNITALTAAIKYGLEHEVNTILLNGDVIDFYAISRFEKDPRKRNFGHEVLMTRQFLTTLRRLFPNAAIYYKCGNHDVRYDHYIMRNAPDLLGMDEFSFESLMHLDKLDITFIPDKQIIHAGKLTILHGHELGASVFSPVNIARGLFLRAKDSALCGHHHQASEHTEPNINGKITTCWSVACLCELHPDYLPINKHHHGFAHITVLDNGDFEVSNYRIVNGKIR
jgi:predicted phosphodiesterase